MRLLTQAVEHFRSILKQLQFQQDGVAVGITIRTTAVPQTTLASIGIKPLSIKGASTKKKNDQHWSFFLRIYWYTRRELNPHRCRRRALFYPLDYECVFGCVV